MTTSDLLPTPEALNQEGYQVANGKKYPRLGAALTSSQEDSPANRSLRLALDVERPMIAISGRKCLELFDLQNPNGSSLRTCAEYLLLGGVWYSNKSALTWKPKVTKSGRLLFQLSPSTLRIDEIGSGLLPTARAANPGSRPNRKGGKVLAEEIVKAGEMLPTPTTGDRRSKKSKQQGINNIVAMLPTPRSSEGEGGVVKNVELKNGSFGRKNRDGTRHGVKVQDAVGATTGLKLQPNFVEWMMGFPQNWTDLNYPKPDTVSNG